MGFIVSCLSLTSLEMLHLLLAGKQKEARADTATTATLLCYPSHPFNHPPLLLSTLLFFFPLPFLISAVMYDSFEMLLPFSIKEQST